ncbi:MAG: carbohydrate ABC transporter permease [Burkholderiaceae bacterium]|nr:carbohydrate ABC transporter permease [Burkholderiaceae bacterium]
MRRILERALGPLVSAAIALAALFPILWGLLTSFKPKREILRFPPDLVSAQPTLEHYQRLLEEGAQRFMLNSVIVSAGALALCLSLGLLAAYAMARGRFAGRSAILVMLVAVMSIPIASLLVPTFTLMTTIRLSDSLTGLVLLYAAYQIPIVVWMLMGFIESLPVELEQAATVDGYSRLAVLWKIVAPLSRPALVAAGLFVLTFAWNDFVVAVVMNSSPETRTFPVAVYNFLGFFGRDWGPLLAASMVSIIPIIVVFVRFQRHFVTGMTSGSVKG